MENEIRTIELIGLKKTRPEISFIRRQIEKWIDREQSLLFLPRKSGYFASISRDVKLDSYTWRIQIRVGTRKWLGNESARTLQEAMECALHHMQSDPFVSVPRSQSELAVEGVA